MLLRLDQEPTDFAFGLSSIVEPWPVLWAAIESDDCEMRALLLRW